MKETLGVTLGEILVRAREKKGWNLTQAAEHLGVAKSQVWHWERGNYLPRKDHLENLAAVYRLSYERLVRAAASERYA